MEEKKEKPSEEHEKKETEKEVKNKPKKKSETLLYWSIGLIIAIIILFFAANRFYRAEPEYPKVTYNNWEFTKMAGMWWFESQKGDHLFTIPLRFNPYDVENISINGKLNSTGFNSKSYVYITFDLSNESSQDLTALALAATELTQNIATAISRTPLAACVNSHDEACEDRPIKTCKNTDEPVIYLKEGGKAQIKLSNNCIILEGKGFELIKAVDRLLYRWYRIM